MCHGSLINQLKEKTETEENPVRQNNKKKNVILEAKR